MRLLTCLMVFFLFVACSSENDPGLSDSDGDLDRQSETDDAEIEESVPDGDAEAVMEIETESDTAEEADSEQVEIETEPQDPYENLLPSGNTIKAMLGVSTHMAQGEGQNDHRDFEFERYVELGGASIREDYHWHHVEPADNDWHFETVATQMQMATERQMKVLAMLAYGVDWAMEESDTGSIDPADYADFAGNLAAHFCENLKDYEIWNEPNITRFWKPGPDAAEYGELLKAAYGTIKAACPDARVYLGGLASYSTDRVTENWWFIDELIEAHPDICDYMDVIAIHPYTLLQKPSPEWDNYMSPSLTFLGQRNITALAREKFATVGCGDLPMVYSEMGWPSYEISEVEQGYFLARSVLLAALENVETYYWYTFWDSSPITEGLRPHEHYFGLFGWRGEDGSQRRAKPAYSAMKALADILGNYRYAGNLSEAFGLPTDVYVLAFLDEGDKLALALWDGRDNPDEYTDPPMEGGPDTKYDLDLPLPDWTTGVTIYNIDGEQTDEVAADGSLQLELTRSVVYMKLHKAELPDAGKH